MRFIALIIIFIMILPLSAKAEGTLVMPYDPWGQAANQQNVQAPRAPDDIMPKKLSLADLEKLTSGQNLAYDAPSLMASHPFKQTPHAQQSTLEELYAGRVVDEPMQFGYNLFDNADISNAADQIPAGVIQSDYILSAGDSLTVTFRGQINKRRNYTIDRQGKIIIDDLPPITAAGRSLGQLETDLSKQVNTLHNTEIFISLNGVRQIGILVVGHVNKPGRQTLTAFHNVLDALNAAGGIEKTGSLRKIKLIRKGRSHFIDLYQLLMASGKGADKMLRDGDRIIVPPIGPTMAVTGSVKRPAIYEIKQGEKLSLHQALGLSGGVLTPGQNRYIKMEYTVSGSETIQDVSTPAAKIFGDGTILNVAQSAQKKASAVTLKGHTRQPGTHDLKKSRTLSGLINDEKVLGNDIYPLIGVIERRDPKQLTKKLVAFSPYQVLHKKYDQKLSEGDVVRLFSMAQIRDLDDAKPLLHKASLSSSKEKMIEDPITRAFLKERAVFARGAIRQEGAYPVTKNTTLENILAVAGGIALEGNPENIEITSRGENRRIINTSFEVPMTVTLKAGDTVRVNQKFHKIHDQSIMIIGEVNHPGRYDLSPGDTLSTLVSRAGGLTDQAYADGALFSRASERSAEESRYKSQAQDLELKLAASLQQMDDDKQPDMSQVSATKSLITQLKNAKAVGRITVEADPASLAANPAQDILLESGDRIYIPKRPMTVRVAGEVLNPAALQFQTGKDPMTYIREAGGTSHFANKNRIFVIYPDGSAQPLNVSGWNHSTAMIPPGSTIIVPRDPKPFDFLESAGRVSQMIANLAISGLYIEAIGDDN